MEMQTNLEDRFTKLAKIEMKTNEKAIILCDRGLMDGSAYLKEETWNVLLDEIGQTVVNIRDKRYDGYYIINFIFFP